MNTVVKNPVGRPREFDEATVLDAVMEVFWQKGYEKTSMADLLEATGLHKGSLYQAFGDKHSLFMLALKRYVAEMGRNLSNALHSAPGAIAGIRQALNYFIDLACHGDGPNAGCLALNTMVDKGMADTEAGTILQAAQANQLAAVAAVVSQAQADGEIRRDLRPEDVARMISIVVMGLVAGLRGPLDREASRKIANDFLLALAPAN